MLFPLLGLFAGAALAPFLHRLTRTWTGALLSLLPLGVLAWAVRRFLLEGSPVRETCRWIPSLGVELSFSLDGLALLFLALIGGMGALILVYASRYLREDPRLGRFYGFLLFFIGSMASLVVADNVFVLFVAWELTSVSSFLLIGWNHDRPESRKAALSALLVTGGGGLALLAGLTLLSLTSGQTDLSRMAAVDVRGHAAYLPILLLVACGAFAKSAQVPFHFWLPRAMEAPTPVSAYLHSATMVKAGVYLLARLHPTLGGTAEWQGLLGSVGAVTMLTGAVLAVAHTDLKRILAYSTVSALGTLVLLLGLGTPKALQAAVVFVAAHALYKGALFLVAGTLDHETGTRDVRLLRGLARAMPVTAATAVLAGASAAGLAPFAGFLAKELLIEGSLHAPTAAAAVATAVVVSAALLVAATMKVAWQPFFGGAPAAPRLPHEAPAAMTAGPVILVLLSLAAGVFAGPFGGLLSNAASAVAGTPLPVDLALWHGLTPALGLSVLALGAGLGLYRLLRGRSDQLLGAAERLGARGPERAYDALYDGSLAFAARLTGVIQSGYLRRYVIVVVATTVALVAWPLYRSLPFPGKGFLNEAHFPEVLLVLAAAIAAWSATRMGSRLAVVAVLGVIGIAVMMIYVLFSALDLALTQIMVEVLTVVILVLLLHHLPRFVPTASRRIWVRDAILCTVFGTMVTLLILMSTTLYPEPALRDYFVANGLKEAHGRNIVNVILVDFRALDTLGETTVLCVAGVGIYALLKMTVRKGP